MKNKNIIVSNSYMIITAADRGKNSGVKKKSVLKSVGILNT